MKRALVVTTAAALLVLVATPAMADGEPGDGFQSYGLTAVSGGQRVLADTIAGQAPGTVDAGVPEAEASITKSTGHALSSVVWPSALAGNLGVLLLLLGPNPCTPDLPVQIPGVPNLPTRCSPFAVPPQIMNQYHYLNDPVRAEAVSPVTPVAENSVPGAMMTARANPTEAVADAVLGGALVSDLERFATTTATSAVKVTGAASAVADARSTITDLNILDVLTIGSVVSSAHGETTGSDAKGSGTTTVNDAKIAGVPVSIDSDGVHVQGQTAALIGPATDAVNQALAGIGMKLFLTRPTQMTQNGVVTFDAGSLIIEFFPPGAPGGVVFELGAAHITAGATLPFVVDIEPVLGDLTGPGGLLGPTSPLSVAGDVATSAAPLAPASTPIQAGAASERAPLPGGIDGWLVLAGLIAAVVAAAALRRLPDRVLAGTAARCETGEEP